MTDYQRAILDTFLQLCRENETANNHRGASPLEVTQRLHENGTIWPLPNPVDVANQMEEMAARGWLSKLPKEAHDV